MKASKLGALGSQIYYWGKSDIFIPKNYHHEDLQNYLSSNAIFSALEQLALKF